MDKKLKWLNILGGSAMLFIVAGTLSFVVFDAFVVCMLMFGVGGLLLFLAAEL